MAKKQYTDIPVSRLRELLRYDHNTGKLFWISARGCNYSCRGKEAGTVSEGYRVLKIAGVSTGAQRVVWALCHGEWPADTVDHIDQNKLNNLATNLRLATRKQNCRNIKTKKSNTSGYKGVSWYPNRNKWLARILTDEGRKYLGYFTSAEKAGRAYDNAARIYHGEFASLNFPDT